MLKLVNFYKLENNKPFLQCKQVTQTKNNYD